MPHVLLFWRLFLPSIKLSLPFTNISFSLAQTTVNNKKVELPVKRIVSGQRVIPSGTLANPKSLEYYYRFVDPEKVAKEQGLVERESKL